MKEKELLDEFKEFIEAKQDKYDGFYFVFAAMTELDEDKVDDNTPVIAATGTGGSQFIGPYMVSLLIRRLLDSTKDKVTLGASIALIMRELIYVAIDTMGMDEIEKMLNAIQETMAEEVMEHERMGNKARNSKLC